MKKRIALAVILSAAAIALAAQTDTETPQQEKVEVEKPLVAGATAVLIPDLSTTYVYENPTSVVEAEEVAQPVEQVVEQPLDKSEKNNLSGNFISDEELTLLAACVQAEAGNQGEQGMRYVCDVILNRVDSDTYPDTITEVITQKGQFAVWPKGIQKQLPPWPETITLCEDELRSRSNYQAIMFRTGHFHPWGTPLFQYKDHYFSAE